MSLAGRVSLLLALALAGCASPAATPPDDAPDAASPRDQPEPQPEPSAPEPVLDALPSLPGAVPVAPSAAPAVPAVIAPYTFITTMQASALEHPRLDIAPGAMVTWRNLDLVLHSVIGEPGGFVGSGPIPPGGEFSQTFERPGTYAYHCRYHDGMSGLVVVA